MTQQSKIQFGYRRHPDQDRDDGDAAHHPIVVVGAGPVGLSLAIDLAQRG
jgi:3-(3-hydroxy-phenyl)propionate hydroxylase